MNFLTSAIFMILASISLRGFCAELEAQSEFIPDSNISLEQKVASTDYKLYLDLQCFGTNLRTVSNPLNPSATLYFYGTVKWENINRKFKVQFPANIFFSNANMMTPANTKVTNLENISLPSRVNFVTEGNKKKIEVTLGGLPIPEVGVTGDFVLPPPTFVSAYIDQDVPVAKGRYFGKDGRLSAQITHQTKGQLVILIRAPGEEKWCGGYHSPVMVFFDDKRPLFTGKSRFALDTWYEQTFTWVEPNAPGYFLAIDRNHDGIISKSDELFGSVAKPNGFESLALEDSNKDKVIDSQDPVFAKLVLWQDRNADGISQKDELIPLSKMKVTSLSLNYQDSGIQSFDSGAQFRQTSQFSFTDPQGNAKSGTVIDVWFNSRGDRAMAQTARRAGPAPFDLPLPPSRGPAWLEPR